MIDQLIQFEAHLGPSGFVRRLLAVLATLFFLAGCATTETLELPDPPVDSAKYAALVVDAATGKTLHESNANAERYPASLTKMMTLYLLFEALEEGRVTKTTRIPVSLQAARQPPTRVGLRAGDTIDVDSAIRALTVKSANDVAAAVGEHLGGIGRGIRRDDACRGAATRHARHRLRQCLWPARSGPAYNRARHGRARHVASGALSAILRLLLGNPFHLSRPPHPRPQRPAWARRGRGRHQDRLYQGFGLQHRDFRQKPGRSLVIVVMGADSARARNAQVEQFINVYLAQPSRETRLASLFAKRWTR